MATDRPLDQQFPFDGETEVASALQSLTRVLESRFQTVEAMADGMMQAETDLRNIAFARINEILLPAVEAVQKVQDLGFLQARSNSNIAPIVGQQLLFTIPDDDEANYFRPGPFVTIEHVTDPNTYAFGETLYYDREHGELGVEIIYRAGSAAFHDNWAITAGSAIAKAAIDARVLAVQKANEAIATAATVAIDKAEALQIKVATEAARDEALDASLVAIARRNEAQTYAGQAAQSAQAAGTANSEIQTYLINKANVASPVFTGVPQAPTAAAGTNTTQLATTAFVAALGALKANIASPTFTGTPAAPTAAASTNTTQIATTAFVQAALAAMLDAAPTTLDTLNELAAALGDDPNFSATMTTQLGLKAPLDSPAITGTPTAPTATAGTNTNQLATTAFVAALGALKANLASPTFTGTPAAPTATAGTNTTQLATTAFVTAAITVLTTGAPANLNTFVELATAIGNDPAYSTTVTTALGLKAPLASPALTGTPTAPTATPGTNTTQLATTAYADAIAALKLDASLVSSLALTLLDDTTQAAMRTTLGLGSLATLSTIAGANVNDNTLLNTKLANVATGTFKARATAGTGSVEDLTVAQAKTLLAITIADVATLQAALDGKQASLGFTPENAANKNVANGYAPLGPDGKVPSANLPADGSYKGTYDASTNTPAITSGSGVQGDFYIVSVGGTVAADSVGAVSAGDQLRRGPTTWQRVPSFNAVSSVAGQTGTVVLTATSISDSTTVGRNLMTAADQPAGRTALGLGALATLATIASTHIDSQAVTNGKLAYVATATFKGRSAAGTGIVEDLTVAQAKTLLAITAADITNATAHARTLLTSADEAAARAAIAAAGTGVGNVFTATQRIDGDNLYFTVAQRGTSTTAITAHYFVTKSATSADTLGSATSKGWRQFGYSDAYSSTSVQNDFALQYWDGAAWNSAWSIDSATRTVAFTAGPTAPTATAGTNTTQLATTAFVTTAVANLINAAPAGLDTLAELATAIGNDPAYSTTVTTALGLKADLASPALTGTPTAPTATAGTNTTQLATTAFVAALGALKANLASPTFTGTPAAPTAAAGTNTTQLATTAFVQAAVTALINAAPGALDTLDELAAALGDDPNFATTITNNLALKAPLASPTFTGTPAAPTATAGTNTTQIATTAFVKAADDAIVGAAPVGLTTLAALANAVNNDTNFAGTTNTALATKAPIASPTFTGTPAAPTATAGTNTTQLATTAFVAALGALKANLASPTFTGTPAAPTAAAGTNTTQLATTAFVTAAITVLTTGAPALLNTFAELANAIGNDENYATTVSTALANRLRFDAAQTLTATQATQALTNLGLQADVRTMLEASNDAGIRSAIGLGQLIRITRVTASATHTLNAETRFWFAEVQGGGGGGGAASSGDAARIACGGGGGSGAYVRTPVLGRTASGTVPCVIGPGGAGGPAANVGAPGSNGSDSSVSDDGVLYTAPGGLGGEGVHSLSDSMNVAPGGLGVVPSGTALTGVWRPGEGGEKGQCLGFTSQPLARGGDGGSSPFGTGGEGTFLRQSTAGGVPGTAGRGYGAGGGGASRVLSAVGNSGGAGVIGVVYIWEFA